MYVVYRLVGEVFDFAVWVNDLDECPFAVVGFVFVIAACGVVWFAHFLPECARVLHWGCGARGD